MQVINLRNTKPKYVNQDDYVYIGRGSKWGNPFKIGPDGNREEVIKKYKEYILKREDLMNSLDELKGKVLSCWCKPLACHGDVLVKLVRGW